MTDDTKIAEKLRDARANRHLYHAEVDQLNRLLDRAAARIEALEADVVRLRALVESAKTCIIAVHDWRGLCDSGSLETFERIADLFYADTGMLRPGKDQAMALGGHPTGEERRAAWDAWVALKNDELDEMIRDARRALDAKGGG